MKESVLPEQIVLAAVTVADGDGFTASVILLEAVIQVELDKLDTSGPTTTRYIPASVVAALLIV